MSLHLPSGIYDIATFALLVVASIILFGMVFIRASHKFKLGPFATKLPQFMTEDNRWHLLLYVVLFAIILAATILVCVS